MVPRPFLVTLLITLPIAAHAEPAAKAKPDLAADFASALTTSGDVDGKKPKAPKVTTAAPAKAEPTTPANQADVPRLAPASPTTLAPTVAVVGYGKPQEDVRPPPPQDYRGDATAPKQRIRPNHRASVLTLDPSQLTRVSNKVEDVARSWKTTLSWDVITIDSYSNVKGRSEIENVALAERSAEPVRASLIRYGVARDAVIVVGHAGDALKVELSVMTCDQCRRPVTPAK